MSEFEKLPEISERIDGWIAFRNGRYWNKSTGYVDQYLTGAWYAYQEQQAIIDSLKTQLNNMEACYIQVKKDRDGLQVRASELLEGVESAMVQLDNWTTAYEILDELRGERESFTETRQKVEAQIENGARLTKHQIDL